MMLNETEPLQRVRAALAASGGAGEISLLDADVTTAARAAERLGVELGSIAKSIVLWAGAEPVLVVAAGDRRVDRQKVRALLQSGRVRMATADEVLEVTGFTVGGVGPVGLLQPLTVLLDESLRRYERIWAGGGVAEALIHLAVDDLPAMTGGRFADVCGPQEG